MRSVLGCYQLSLTAFYNLGSLMHYPLRKFDKIKFQVGVGKSFSYTLQADIKQWASYGFDNAIAFPCFSGEQMYIQLSQYDYPKDFTLIWVDCDKL